MICQYYCRLLDYTYCGWGHKLNVNSYKPLVYSEYQLEYPNDSAEITEIKDPTYTDELRFFENIKKIKEEKKNRKFAFTPQSINEDKERILNQYFYD